MSFLIALSLRIFVDLWSQVVLQTPQVLNLVLHNQWCLCGQHQLHEVAEDGSFVEHVQVAEGKAQANSIFTNVFLIPFVCLDFNGA